MIHSVKCYPEYFKLLTDGSKTFEVRENDRIYEVGDYLAVNEFMPESDPYTVRKNPPEIDGKFNRAADDGFYSGNCALFRITYILDNPQFCKEGMDNYRDLIDTFGGSPIWIPKARSLVPTPEISDYIRTRLQNGDLAGQIAHDLEMPVSEVRRLSK